MWGLNLPIATGLLLADITGQTPDPVGGVFERDEDAAATGVIREHQDIVGRLIPDSTVDDFLGSLTKNRCAVRFVASALIF
jgi:predicted amidohydrolase YtcJ